MACNQLAANLYLVDLDQNITGFRKFIGSWLYLGESLNFMVDPGPSQTIDRLIGQLEKLSVQTLDYILLTHIHIDHAGGTGKLLERFPKATVICHPQGINHLIDPGKLWEGSLKVLGDIARAYGPIIPVAADRIRFQELIETPEGQISVIQTPGHAIHHQCFQFKEWLFAGEVAGVRHVAGSLTYARPATPPVFKLEISLGSLDKIIALQPRNLCLGHFGYLETPGSFLENARNQLLMWVETTREGLEKGEEGAVSRITKELLAKDELIGAFNSLEDDIKQREEYFIGNSVKGMVQYIKSQEKT